MTPLFWTILALCVSCTTTVAQISGRTHEGCPTHMHRYKSSCFWVSKEFLSIHGAKQRCRAQKGRLAAPSDYDTQRFLMDITDGGTMHHHWIGLERVMGVWKFSDNTPLGLFEHWAAAEPSEPANQNCVYLGALAAARWVTASCHWGYRFICQLDGCDTAELGLLHMRIAGAEMHYRLQGRVLMEGESVAVECREGVLQGPSNMTCHAGRWSDRSQCIVGCPAPRLSPLARLASPKVVFSVGEKPQVQCPINHAVVYGDGLTCQANGRWKGKAPECRAWVTLPPASTPTKYHVRVTKSQYPPTTPATTPQSPLGRCLSGRGMRTDLVSTITTVTADEHKSLSIPCTEERRGRLAPDQPSPSWVWMKEQQLLKAGDINIPHARITPNGTLSISKMTHAAEGLYLCIASGPAWPGGVTYKAFHLVLPKKSCHLKLEFSPEKEVVMAGDVMVLRCFAPEAEISWFRNNQPLGQGDDHHIVLPNGALIIQRNRPVEKATYLCRLEHIKTRCRVERSVSVAAEAELDLVCGKRRVSMPAEEERSNKGKVVGGKEAPRGLHPWSALLVTYYQVINETHLCGGSLIASQWVVTAAHCFYMVASVQELIPFIKVKLGKHDMKHSETGELVLGVVDIVTHRHFDRTLRSFNNDIALVRLERSVSFSDQIIPICLPEYGFLDRFFPLRRESVGIVSGWGKLLEDGLQPQFLHHVRLPLVDQDLCRSTTDLHVTNNMFCAGYEQAVGDSCQGDSGGPFEMVLDDRVVLAGLVSWGEGCSRAGKYGFYTKVENYLNFIYDIVNTDYEEKRN